MDAIQVNPGRTPRKDQNEKIIKIPKSPTKYVFKPEVVKASPIRSGFKRSDTTSKRDGNREHRNIPKNLFLRQDATVGFKGFFSSAKSPDNSLDRNKVSRGVSSHREFRDIEKRPKSRERKENKGRKSPDVSSTARCRCGAGTGGGQGQKSPKEEGLFTERRESIIHQSPIDKNGNPGSPSKPASQSPSFQDRAKGLIRGQALLNQKFSTIKSELSPSDEILVENSLQVKTSPASSSSPPPHPAGGVSVEKRTTFKCECCGESHHRSTSPKNHNVSLQNHIHNFYGTGIDGRESPFDEHHDERFQDSNSRRYLLDRRQETPVASLLYRSRSLPQLSVHDSGVGSNEQVPGRPASRLVADLRQLLTLKQHYYPEGGWGWVILVVGMMVQLLSHGIHGASGVLLPQVAGRFGPRVDLQSGVLVHVLAAGIHGAAGIWLIEGMRKYRQPLINVGWLGAMSTGVALLVSPVTIAFCRRKSTRVTAVLGGLVTALGCLFTSFASQFHQLFFSYGTVVGIGVGMTRDCSTLMVAQYFKRRREFVEIFIVSGSGLGIAVMSAFIKGAISKIGWRLGLQAVTGVVFLTFILGTFYRSASLYHPQRRAILHLKNQKRKIKDKNKVDDRPPFFDFSTLKSKTVRILLVSTGISAFGINTPIFYLAHQAEEEGLGDTVVLLQTYLGLAWTLGCVAFGLLVVHHSVECRIARQYLTQAAVFMCGLCILALTAVHGNYHGYVMFTWIYGIFCGGYHYSLKMYTYERVRARNFARTWGFVQCSQAIPIAIGVPISGYINVGCGGKAGYYFSSTCVLVGSFTLFFIDLHRRSLSRHKHTRANGTRHLCVSDNCPQRRRLSFTQEPENEGVAAGAAAAALMLGAELAPAPGEIAETLAGEKPELTCISEEGIADMDLPDNLLDDLDYIGDCITSCNKVENYLMLSEFENNLIAEMPIILDRKGRRWSLARSKGQAPGSQGGASQGPPEEEEVKPKWRLMTAPPNNRVITVIDEAST